MDEDHLDLTRQLSTRAGMMMEDASAVAILVARLSPDELRAAIAQARTMTARAITLLDAASTLTEQDPRS